MESMDTEVIFRTAKDKVPARIVEAGSTDVDVASGATYSSRGIMAAVDNALAQAK